MANQIPNDTIKKKVTLLTLLSCYVFAIATMIFLTTLFSDTSESTNNIPTGTRAMVDILAAPTYITYDILLSSVIALPLFGIWRLIQKYALKNHIYTEQTLKRSRRFLILVSVLLIAILIIQAAQY